MNLFELLDLTFTDYVAIRDGDKTLYIGEVENTPYKYLIRRVIAFSIGDIDEHFSGLIIKI